MKCFLRHTVEAWNVFERQACPLATCLIFTVDNHPLLHPQRPGILRTHLHLMIVLKNVLCLHAKQC